MSGNDEKVEKLQKSFFFWQLCCCCSLLAFFFLTSILNFPLNEKKNIGCCMPPLKQLLKGVVITVSAWNFVKMYKPVLGQESYATYLDPSSAHFFTLSIGKVDVLFVWMSSIERYLNWSNSTFISWDRVHILVLGDSDMAGFSDSFKTLFFLSPGNFDPAKKIKLRPYFLRYMVENNRLLAESRSKFFTSKTNKNYKTYFVWSFICAMLAFSNS